MKIGLAAQFRHRPEDGSFISAAKIVPGDRRRGGGPWAGRIMPLIGYLCGWDGNQFHWGFIKYESPWLWPQGSERYAQSHGAEISTCRVGEFDCPDCHQRVKFISRGKRDECPCCGSRRVNVDLIKDGSPEHLAMVADLQPGLEQAARAAYDDAAAPAFSFPVVVAGGTNITPDPTLDPAALGIAQSHGRGLKALANMAGLDELRQVQNGDLAILPGVTSGFADYEQVRQGVVWESGCMRFYLKPHLPQPSCGPTPFSSFVY